MYRVTKNLISVDNVLILFCQLKDSQIAQHGDATTNGSNEFVQEVIFNRLTPGSVIAFR